MGLEGPIFQAWSPGLQGAREPVSLRQAPGVESWPDPHGVSAVPLAVPLALPWVLYRVSKFLGPGVGPGEQQVTRDGPGGWISPWHPLTGGHALVFQAGVLPVGNVPRCRRLGRVGSFRKQAQKAVSTGLGRHTGGLTSSFCCKYADTETRKHTDAQAVPVRANTGLLYKQAHSLSILTEIHEGTFLYKHTGKHSPGPVPPNVRALCWLFIPPQQTALHLSALTQPPFRSISAFLASGFGRGWAGGSSLPCTSLR